MKKQQDEDNDVNEEDSRQTANSPQRAGEAMSNAEGPRFVSEHGLVVLVAVGYDLVVNIVFHIATFLVLNDLDILNTDEDGSTLFLSKSYFHESKGHFWALFGCSWNAHLNNMSVVMWAIVAYGIAKADYLWIRTWVILKTIVTFLMVPSCAAIALGGENTFTMYSCGFFFFYYLLTVIVIEIVSAHGIYLQAVNRELGSANTSKHHLSHVSL